MKFFLILISLGYLNAQEISTDTVVLEKSTATISKNFNFDEKKVSISGIVLTPTAYRSKGKNSVGTALDINGSYYIGRLYGKNKFEWTQEKKDYLDRVGIWLLSADGKIMIQSEGKYRPAIATGIDTIFKFRDGTQPSLNSPSFSGKVNSKNSDTYISSYISISKRLYNKFFLNFGYANGDMPKVIYQLSEYLSENAINLTNHTSGRLDIPNSAIYGGFIWLFKEKSPIAMEIIIPQEHSPLNPKLINLQLGTLLKLNFQISYLTYKGGWEYLGMFNFRYSYFPK